MKEYCIISFLAAEHALRAERILRDKEVSFLLIPTPREITTGCGLALRLDCRDLPGVKSLMEQENIIPQGIYRQKRTAGKSLLEKFLGEAE
jgi:hypothetical protein